MACEDGRDRYRGLGSLGRGATDVYESIQPFLDSAHRPTAMSQVRHFYIRAESPGLMDTNTHCDHHRPQPFSSPRNETPLRSASSTYGKGVTSMQLGTMSTRPCCALIGLGAAGQRGSPSNNGRQWQDLECLILCHIGLGIGCQGPDDCWKIQSEAVSVLRTDSIVTESINIWQNQTSPRVDQLRPTPFQIVVDNDFKIW